MILILSPNNRGTLGFQLGNGELFVQHSQRLSTKSVSYGFFRVMVSDCFAMECKGDSDSHGILNVESDPLRARYGCIMRPLSNFSLGGPE